MPNNSESSFLPTDYIIEMMQFGQSPEKRLSIEQARHVLYTVERITSFYEENTPSKKSPIICLPQINDAFEQTLVDYLTIRFGLLNEKYLLEIVGQYQNKIRSVVPEKGSKADRESKKIIEFYDTNGNCIPKKSLWDYRLGFNMIAYRMSTIKEGRRYFKEQREVNTFVYDRQFFPSQRNSLLSKYVNKGFSTDCRINALIEREDASSVARVLKYSRNRRSSTFKGSLFVVYVNSQRYRSFNNMAVLRTFNQLGYDVRNLFVFQVSERGFSLKDLMDEKIRLSNAFNGQSKPEEDFFCYSPEDAIKLIPEIAVSTNRVRIPCENDFDVYFPQVADLLEGFGGRVRILCNILSLCATKACEGLFLSHLRSLNPEFECDEVIQIFEYLRNLWANCIVPKIRTFVGDTTQFAFVIEYSTPESIKQEIRNLFPEKQIVFKKPSELAPKHGAIDIQEKKIVVMRYLPCKAFPSSYPNSYDPYIINPGQALMELIPEILFKSFMQRSQYNQTRHTNRLLDSPFRRTVLNWQPKRDSGLYNFNSLDIFGDEEWTDDDDVPTNSAERVRLETEDGSVSSPIDTEPVIYLLGENNMAVGNLREIVNNTEIRAIQFLSEIEPQLRNGLLANRERNGISADKAIRDDLQIKYPNSVFTTGEVWKLALRAKIESDGFDKVLSELSPKLEEKRLADRLRVWSDPTSSMTLPQKKKTRKVLFDYIGVSQYHSYLRSLYNRYLTNIRDSREINALIDSIVKSTVGHTINEDYYVSLSNRIPEAFELFGIESLDDLQALKAIIEDCIVLKNIKSITSYDE